MSQGSSSSSAPGESRLPKLYGCSSIDLYAITGKLGEGTFGQVHRGTFKPTSTAVALKEIIIHERDDGIPITALREIKIMKALKHPNILHLLDMAVDKSKPAGKRFSTFYMVMSYMDHDMCGLLHNRDIKFTLPHIKLYMQQLLAGVEFLHAQQYMHRDMKSANVLVSHNGNVKIADFGLARKYFEAPPSLQSATPAVRRYTPKVVTRWYRPPELLLGEHFYTTAIDMWGVGCIFGEFFKRRVIIPGESDLDQLQLIFKLVGSPNDENMPGYARLPVAKEIMPIPQQQSLIQEVFHNVPSEARELLTGLLTLDPLKRLTAKGALNHKFFTQGVPAAEYGALPEFPSSREIDVRRKRQAPSPPPDGTNPNKRFNNNNSNGNRRIRAFAPKIPNKRDLRPHEQIPPYKRKENRRTSYPPRSDKLETQNEAAVMRNGLNY